MKKIPTIVVVAAALVRADGCVLVQQRAPGRAMAGLWEFPGGKMEDEESARGALARELREELGIEVAGEDMSPVTFASEHNGAADMILLLFLCRRWSGEPRALDAAALRWVTCDEMRALPMPPADGPLISPLEALL